MNLPDILTDFIFPPVCLFCGKLLSLGTRPLFCESCNKRFNAFEGVCCRCGSSFVMKNGLPHCNTCRSARHPFDGVISSFFYSGGVRRAIIEHKFDMNYNNAPTLSEKLSEIIEDLFPNMEQCLLIPVPSSRRRLHERGYDAVWEIAQEISDNTDIPISTKLLKKRKDTPQQSTLTLRHRLRNIHGSFAVSDKMSVKDKNIILIDDVYTTGATTRECAKVLKRNGAAYVMIATVAISENFRR